MTCFSSISSSGWFQGLRGCICSLCCRAGASNKDRIHPGEASVGGVSGTRAIRGRRGSSGRVLSPMCGWDRMPLHSTGGLGWLGRGALGLGLLAAIAAPSSALPSAGLVSGRAAGTLTNGKKNGLARSGGITWEAGLRNLQVPGQRRGELRSLRGGGKPGVRVVRARRVAQCCISPWLSILSTVRPPNACC